MKAVRFTIYLDVFATAKDAQHSAASHLRQVANYLEQLPPEAVQRPLMAGVESGGITGHPVVVEGARYPGQGDAWADFLHHRARVIDDFFAEGKAADEIAGTLSMDPVQVRLIYGRGRDEAFASVPAEDHWKAIWKVEERD